jgi:hypothetical protein
MQTRLSPAHPDFGKVGFTELEERIRNRAYQLYEKRGYAHCHALVRGQGRGTGRHQRRVLPRKFIREQVS